MHPGYLEIRDLEYPFIIPQKDRSSKELPRSKHKLLSCRVIMNGTTEPELNVEKVSTPVIHGEISNLRTERICNGSRHQLFSHDIKGF